MDGDIIRDTTWDRAGSPYWLEAQFNVSPGATLRVLDGVDVLFNETAALSVRGSLLVLGTQTEPVLFKPNETWSWGRSSIGVLGGSLSVRNATIERGEISAYLADTFLLDRVRYLQGYSIVLTSIRDVTVTESEFTFRSITGFQVHDSDAAIFSHNRVHSLNQNFGGDGIWLRTPGAKIIDNIIEGFTSGVKVEANDVLVRANDVSGCGIGVLVSRSAFAAVVERNLLHDNQAGVGFFGLSNGGTIRGNVIYGDNGAGVVLDDAQWVNVTANVIVDNRVGVDVRGATNATVFDNTIRGNELGIRLFRGGTHRAYHNWILDNVQQAFDSSGLASWDNGYPMGGNHWSDYIGDDVYRGPLQDMPGPDGIGDAARPIGPSGVDRYPFASVPTPGLPAQVTAQAMGPDVVLRWQAAAMADDYLLYTADTPTGFDFTSRVSLGNVTAWTDPGAGNVLGAKYYMVRARNATWDRAGPTSNTAGKWTHAFPDGTSTLAHPLEPYPWVDYGQPGWVDTAAEFVAATGALSISYIEAGVWHTVPGGGDPSQTLLLGQGYVATFPAPTTFTFTGLPGSTIDYAGWPPYPLPGFDPATTAQAVSAEVEGDNVTIRWNEIPGFGAPGSAYEVYYADAPWKLRGSPWTDYRLLEVVAATGVGNASAVHAAALTTGARWFYLVVPVQDGYARGSSTYSIGVSSFSLDQGYASLGLPLRPYSGGAYGTMRASDLMGPGLTGLLWFDLARQDWVAHAAWMPGGTYDATIEMVMAVQVDVATPTRFVFLGV